MDHNPDANEQDGTTAKESIQAGGMFLLRTFMTMACMFVSSGAGAATLVWVHYLLGTAKSDGLFDQLQNIDGHNILALLEAIEGLFAGCTILGFAILGAVVGWKEQWRIGTGKHESRQNED